MKKITLCLVVGLLTNTGCGMFSDSSSLSEMTLERLNGSITVLRGDEEIEVEDSVGLEAGDIVASASGAEGRLRLEGERGIAVVGSGELAVRDERTIEGLSGSGDLLIRAGEPIRVVLGEVTARASDVAFRVDRATGSTRIGTYKGTVDLSAPGQTDLNVDALHQVSVAAGGLQPVRPYRMSYRDEWDQLFLADAIEVDREIRSLGIAVSRQLGKSRLKLSFFQELGGRDVPFLKAYLRLPLPNLLIAFNIARTLGSPIEASFRRTLSLFRSGAQWGIVVALLDVPSKVLLARLEGSILSTGAIARGPNGPAVAAGPGPGGGTGSGGSAGEPGGDTSGTTTGGTAGGGGGGDPGGGGGGGDECDNAVDCTIDELPVPLPSPSILDGSLDR